jgi:RHS repeat-associated protein
VYFDDLSIKHVKSPVIQYNDYYAYGLQTGNSWTRDNTKNNFLYNEGSEQNPTSGNYDHFFRNYDPALARFVQVDPLASKYHSWSTYNYAYADPVYYTDPSGAGGDDAGKKTTDNDGMYGSNWNYSIYGGSGPNGNWSAAGGAFAGGRGGIGSGNGSIFHQSNVFSRGILYSVSYTKIGSVTVGTYTGDKYDWIENTDYVIDSSDELKLGEKTKDWLTVGSFFTGLVQTVTDGVIATQKLQAIIKAGNTVSRKLGGVGLLITLADYKLSKEVSSAHILDAAFGIIGLLPGAGTVIGGAYFIINGVVILSSDESKSIGQHLDGYLTRLAERNVQRELREQGLID